MRVRQAQIQTLRFLTEDPVATKVATHHEAEPHTSQAREMSMTKKNIHVEPKEIQVEHHAEISQKRSWSITASSGRESIRFNSTEGAIINTELLFAVSIDASFWERKANSGRLLVEDFHVDLKQIVIPKESVLELLSKLKKWLESPGEISCSLSTPTSGQTLLISLGSHHNVIIDRGKSVICMTYEAGHAFKGEWAFVVDQSCVRIAVEELAQFTTEE